MKHRGDTVLGSFDQAFRLYRKHLRSFFVPVVILFISLLLPNIVFLTDLPRMPVSSVIMFLILGVDTTLRSEGYGFLRNGYIVRELGFFDGTLPWVVFSTALSVQVFRIDGTFGKLNHKIYLRLFVLIMLATATVMFLYRINLPWIALLIRLLWLFTPCLLLSEGVVFSLGYGVWLFFRYFLSVCAIFCLSFLLVRLVIIAVYVGLYVFMRDVLQVSFGGEHLWGVFLIAWLAVLSVLYPSVHIFVVLSYQRLRSQFQKQIVVERRT